jgi:hypothetical protein
MDQEVKKALKATKELHKRLRELEAEDAESDDHKYNIDWKPLKKLAVDTNRAIQAVQRHASAESICTQVRENILREAVRDDMIDREANAARILDKQRTMLESNGSGSIIFEKARVAAYSVESAIAALCPHQTKHSTGVPLLAEAESACFEKDKPLSTPATCGQ